MELLFGPITHPTIPILQELDEDTEEEKTPERIDGWCAQVLEEFKQELVAQ